MRRAVLDAMMIDRCSCGGYTATPEVGVFAFTRLFLGAARLSIFLDVLECSSLLSGALQLPMTMSGKLSDRHWLRGLAVVMTWRHVTVRTSSNKLHERSGCS